MDMDGLQPLSAAPDALFADIEMVGKAVVAVASEMAIAARTIATIGDAPNDAGLWQARRFGMTVGCESVVRQRDQIAHLPTYICADGATGWVELARRILSARAA